MTKGKTNGSSSGSNNNNNNKPTIVEKDADAPFELPMSVVTRTIKAAVPEGTTIARDSRLAIARSAGVFVMYLTAMANDAALRGKRSTVQGVDIVAALEEMGFDAFLDECRQRLAAVAKPKAKGKGKAGKTKGKTKGKGKGKGKGKARAAVVAETEKEKEKEKEVEDDEA